MQPLPMEENTPRSPLFAKLKTLTDTCSMNAHLLLNPFSSEDTAALINDMLQTAAHDGTAKKLSALPFEICGKTGTCGTETGNTDAWTIAYTSEHLMGVWMGNADNRRTDISGGGLPCHYAALLAKHLYAIRKPTPFPHCDSVIRCKLDRASYECDHIVRAAAPKQPSRYTFTELFRKSNLPTIESPIFAHPNSRAQIHVRDNNVLIDLCQTQYYEYRIKREVDGKEKTILDGPCSGQWMDSRYCCRQAIHVYCDTLLPQRRRRLYLRRRNEAPRRLYTNSH